MIIKYRGKGSGGEDFSLYMKYRGEWSDRKESRRVVPDNKVQKGRVRREESSLSIKYRGEWSGRKGSSLIIKYRGEGSCGEDQRGRVLSVNKVQRGRVREEESSLFINYR